MSDNDINSLIDKYLKKSISEEEFVRLEILLEFEENAELFKKKVKEDYLIKTENREFDSQSAYEKVKLEIDTKKRQHRIGFQKFYRYAAAAIIVLGMYFGGQHLWLSNTKNHSSDKITVKPIELVFDDGTVQKFSEKDETRVYGKNNAILGTIRKGLLSYGDSSSDEKKIYNTLKVPFGKRFQLLLADGTRVHLNAGSSLRYPISFFEENKREVYLEGEAFFDVATDSTKRFIVKTGDIEVEVFGTQFNINSYHKQGEIVTTLMEGSVSVKNANNQIFMVPNEQTIFRKVNGEMQKRLVEVNRFTAWINGEIVFTSTPFNEILNVLERKYDVKIINKIPDLNNQQFTARFTDEDVEQIMLYFSKSYGFEYTIEQNIMTINK